MKISITNISALNDNGIKHQTSHRVLRTARRGRALGACLRAAPLLARVTLRCVIAYRLSSVTFERRWRWTVVGIGRFADGRT